MDVSGQIHAPADLLTQSVLCPGGARFETSCGCRLCWGQS